MMNTKNWRRALLVMVTIASGLAIAGGLTTNPVAAYSAYGSSQTTAATWADSSGRLYTASNSTYDSDAGQVDELLVSRQLGDGSPDASWGTDGRTGDVGVRRIPMDIPYPRGAAADAFNVRAVAMGGDGTISVLWFGRRESDEYGTFFFQLYPLGGDKIAAGNPVPAPEYVSFGTIPLADGSFVVQRLLDNTNLENWEALWYSSGGALLARVLIQDPDPQGYVGALAGAATDGAGRLYLTSRDGVVRRVNTTGGVDLARGDGCTGPRAFNGEPAIWTTNPWGWPEPAYDHAYIPIAGADGAFATACGSGGASDRTPSLRVRRYSPAGAITSDVTDAPDLGPVLTGPQNGVFDSTGRLWIGGRMCQRYDVSDDWACGDDTEVAALTTSGPPSDYVLGDGGAAVDGMRSIGDGRVSFANLGPLDTGSCPDADRDCWWVNSRILPNPTGTTTTTTSTTTIPATTTPQTTQPPTTTIPATTTPQTTQPPTTTSAPSSTVPQPTQPPTTTSPPPVSPDQAFVASAYRDLIGRPPTPSELSSAVADLTAGRRTRASIAASLATSPEAVSEQVRRSYEDVLGRPADAAGLAYWVDSLETRRAAPVRLLAAFYSSREFYRHRGGSNPRTWVTALYQGVFGRRPDADGLAYWSAQASTAGRTRVAARLLRSPEGRRARVTNLYRRLLGRDPDTAGLAYWSERIDVIGDLALAARLVASSEYLHRAQSHPAG